ncbi:hypothetical protein pb186bvf_017601 [Paramecium bursaria]
MRSKLQTLAMRKWLISRCSTKAQEQYLTVPEIKEYEKDLELLFRKVAPDSQINKQELCEIFNKYGIEVTPQELNQYVSLANQKSGPNLTVKEFKSCVDNEQAKTFFRRIIRKSNERHPEKQYPTEICRVINQVNYLQKRGRLVSQITDEHLPVYQKLQPLQDLVGLSKEINVGSKKRFRRTRSTNYYISLPREQNLKDFTTISTTNTSTNNSRFHSRKTQLF